MQDLFGRMADAGFEDVREGHGCVFGFIDLEHGSRLTDLAERARLTKQAVGEAVAELERLGYVERACRTRGTGGPRSSSSPSAAVEAALTGRRLFAEIETEWAERYGEERIATAWRAPRRSPPAASGRRGGHRLTGATASPS